MGRRAAALHRRGTELAKAGSVAPGRSSRPGRGGGQRAFEPPHRIQTSLLSSPERRAIDALCPRMPLWVTPDRLTAIGSAGAALAALGYVGAHWRLEFLFVSSLGVAINWFGNSLDGSLARYRKIERPRYGFFLDHSVDALNGLVFAIGLGLSPFVGMAPSLLLLCSYYLLTVYVILSAQVDQEFPLTKNSCRSDRASAAGDRVQLRDLPCRSMERRGRRIPRLRLFGAGGGGSDRLHRCVRGRGRRHRAQACP